MEKAAVEAATVGDVDLLPWGAEGIAGFTADLVVEHTLPPYAVEDQADYDGVVLKIKLYDSATMGGDDIQGDYLGLTTEADYATGT